MIERCGADHKSDNDRDDDNVEPGRYDDGAYDYHKNDNDDHGDENVGNDNDDSLW